ncbi:MAG: hypothetical protein EZS28_019934 [Streblomastix strix]|uniref:Uncharacterized protein n=1 Tax=Streblomastix strix TaxID=222440 RepID=A0A5J4VPY7_9EUKA|nr:MAG: hypothetical protein EZS28_019934 [Streblomastix strix]
MKSNIHLLLQIIRIVAQAKEERTATMMCVLLSILLNILAWSGLQMAKKIEHAIPAPVSIIISFNTLPHNENMEYVRVKKNGISSTTR